LLPIAKLRAHTDRQLFVERSTAETPACNAAQNGWMISGRIRVLNMTIDAPILE
jgi:hypothetical protein